MPPVRMPKKDFLFSFTYVNSPVELDVYSQDQFSPLVDTQKASSVRVVKAVVYFIQKEAVLQRKSSL